MLRYMQAPTSLSTQHWVSSTSCTSRLWDCLNGSATSKANTSNLTTEITWWWTENASQVHMLTAPPDCTILCAVLCLLCLFLCLSHTHMHSHARTHARACVCIGNVNMVRWFRSISQPREVQGQWRSSPCQPL